MIAEIKDLSKLCVHTLTTKPWNIEECVKNYAAAGIKGITIWRNVLENRNLTEVKKMLDEFDMEVVSLARGGFFPSVDQKSVKPPLMTIFLRLSRLPELGHLRLCLFVVRMVVSRWRNRGIRLPRES